ncbi:MAG: RIP metalloprotease RseP [Haliscomenobacteraceae bacterium CHB4]|nr:putative zinc metalloprotease [Saprospiraceae bacterium]MCE7926267.1 RIP metalloprotease RseP [Haliscomenobacteraceae bacterium CHB4]
MDSIITVSQFLLSLSILIVLHELGHFLPAKWFKTRVEKFYLFFDFAPFNSLWKTKKGETEYGIGWLPLGGYVKISGMVDESMDTESLKQPPKPWEFRSKPAWQRLIIMVGGVTVNFLLGFFIFGMMLWGYGRAYIPTSELKYGLAMDSVLLNIGLQNGDNIVKLGDQPFERLDPGAFIEALVLNDIHQVTVIRDGREQVLDLPSDVAKQITGQKIPKALLMTPRIPFVVEEVVPGKPADGAKIQPGDRIISFNGQPIPYFDQFSAVAQQHKGQAVTLGILRNADTIPVNLTLTENGLIGVRTRTEGYFSEQRERYSFFEALPAGVTMGMDFLNNQLKAFGQMFKGKIDVKDNLGSLISIGKMYGSEWDWERFWNLTASLSIILAFMNLLPIPALDGGYVVFLLWEVITRRKVSDSVMEKAVTVGFFLLLGLMIFALGNDIWRHWIQKLF